MRFDWVYSRKERFLGRNMKRERGLRLLSVMVALCVPIACAQSLPTIQPPTQTWIYDFGGAFFAPVPAAPELNLGANFSIELWAMLDLDAVDGQYMRVFTTSNAYELDFEAALTNSLIRNGRQRTH